MHDLILRGGRVICPEQGLDAVRDVAFAGGRVAEIAPRIETPAAEARDVSGLVVTPGLIDMHAHVYFGATSMSLDPARIAPVSGVATIVDAGTAGPGNFEGLRRFVIEPSPVRIIPFLNVSFAGIFAYSRAVMVGECADMRLLDPREVVRVAREHSDLIAGIKVRVGRIAGGNSGVAPLEIAIEAAEEAGLPVMSHLDDPPPSRKAVLDLLRPGDILTHCFKPFPNAPVRSDGEIHEEVLMARERGVIFDVGHGAFSWGIEVTRRMLERGFRPDVISSDVHLLNVEGPVFDQLHVLSKFLCLGMELPEVIRASTSAPAAALKRPDLGHLRVGAPAEATVIAVEEGRFRYTDARAEVLEGDRRLRCRGMVTPAGWQESPATYAETTGMFPPRKGCGCC